MGRQHWQLLVCSATAIALLATSLFAVGWFRIDLMGSSIAIDLHSASLCSPDGICASVPLSKLKGMYPTTSTVAFFTGLLLLLVVVVQSASKLVTGVAHDRITRIGYLLALLSTLAGFAAGYVFGPEAVGLGHATSVGSVTVDRTWAPFAFLVGSVASFGALYFATLEAAVEDTSSAYKPIKLDKRLPVTPISGVHRVPTPPRNVIPDSQPFDGPVVRRAPTNNELLRTRPPSSTPPFGGARSDAQGRSLTPSSGLRTEDLRSKTSSTSPPVGGRSMTPGGGFTGTSRTMTPAGGSARNDAGGARSNTPGTGFARTDAQGRAITPSGGFSRVEDSRTKSPGGSFSREDTGQRTKSSTGGFTREDTGQRTKSPTGGFTREDTGQRTKSPTGGFTREDTGPRPKTATGAFTREDTGPRPKTSTGREDTVPRAKTATGREDTGPRPKTSTGGFSREDTGPRPKTSTGGFSREDTGPRPKTSTGGFSREDTGPRPKSPTQQPLVSRTTSPTGIADPTRSKSPSQSPVDQLQRSRTSSSGPIDLAARLSASVPNVFDHAAASGSPLEVSIRPPLPSPDPVPADQIPVDPAAGLTIRKRTQSSAPLSESQLPPMPEVKIRKSSSVVEPMPMPSTKAIEPAAASVLPDDAFAPPSRERRNSAAPQSAAPEEDSMPQISIEGLDELAEALKAAAELPAPAAPIPAASPASTSALAADSTKDIDNAKAADATKDIDIAKPADTAKPADNANAGDNAKATDAAKPADAAPHALPEYVRGKIKFAALTVELASGGLKARREDGLDKLVPWGELVGIVARRFPADKPFEGATFVDLLSTAGATIRIVPWTRIDGHKFERSPVERARSFVNIVAAMALEARLDGATKKFAEGTANAAQLPDAAAMATHDDKVG